MHLILRAHLNSGGKIEAEGTLEVLPDGFGFLRSKNTNYLSGHDDIYIQEAATDRTITYGCSQTA